jgi:hypothetical protein
MFGFGFRFVMLKIYCISEVLMQTTVERVEKFSCNLRNATEPCRCSCRVAAVTERIDLGGACQSDACSHWPFGAVFLVHSRHTT